MKLDIPIAGLLIAGAILLNGELDRRHRSTAEIERCTDAVAELDPDATAAEGRQLCLATFAVQR